MTAKQARNRLRRPVIGKNIQAVFDSLPAQIAVLDEAGTILAVNAAWCHFAKSNGYAGTDYGLGLNYLEICAQAIGSADAHAVERAIRAIIAGEQAEYSYEYPYHTPDQQHWFRFRATRLAGAGPTRVIVSHDEMTQYKPIEARLSTQITQTPDETRSRLQALFDCAQDAFLLANDQGQYIGANPAACTLTGYSYAELVCLNIVDLTPPPDRPKVQAAWHLFINAGVRRGDYMLLRKDGSLVPVEFIGVTQIEAGVHLSVLRDITGRRAMEDSLHDHATRLDLLHEIDQVIISARSIESICQATLSAIYRLMPYWRASVLVFDLELSQFQLAAVCHNGVALETPARHFLISEIAEAAMSIPSLKRGEHHVFDLRDMLPRWPEAAELLSSGMRYQICTPLLIQSELFGSLQIVVPTQEYFDSIYLPIIRDMLASLAIGLRQARLFDQVRAGRERLHELSRRLVAAQELERRQVARDLHDQIGQNLAVLNVSLSITRDHLSRESAQRVDARLADAIKLVDQTVEQIRNVMADLRPAVLDDFGLVAALRWYTHHVARHTDLVVLLEVEEPRAALRLPSDLETALFRIAQEALTNVIKHARATQATLQLTLLNQTIRMAISDDGVGFGFGASRQPNQRWSLGLMTMQERVDALGGQLVIDSVPGQGTRIIVEAAR